MPQTQTPTDEGFGELGRLAAGGTASPFKRVCCYEGAVICVASESDADATVPKSTKIGMGLQDADTVTTTTTAVTDDTVQIDHIFTAGEAVNVIGFGVWNTSGGTNKLYGSCCFAAVLPFETSDTLTVQMLAQFKKFV
jgi:hypothetical protein